MWRYLKENKGNSLPRRVVVFDTEANQAPIGTHPGHKLQTFRLGVADKWRWRSGQPAQRQRCRFTHPDTFWRFVIAGARERETTWVFAHSLLYDLRMVGFCELLEREVLVIDKPRVPRNPASNSAANRGGRALAVFDAPPTIICLRHVASGAKLLCVDTLNWLKLPLHMIGAAMDLPKLEMPDFADDNARWFTYCERDVDIAAELAIRLVRLVESHGLGNFGKTIAQQAMNAFRHRWMKHKLCLHDEPFAQQLERASYFGGRTECFRIGALPGRTHAYDVSALYPSVMAASEYPVRLLRCERREDYLPLAPAVDPAASVARVRLRPRSAVYPLRTDHCTVYPLGEFETTLAGVELARAASRGEIIGWKDWATYETAPLFTAAIGELWQWRQAAKARGDQLTAQLVKLLANSMYGKFGQRNFEWLDQPAAIAPWPWHQWIELDTTGTIRTLYRSVGWHVQQQSERGNVHGSFVAIAAFVTAAGRCRMNDLRAAAGGDNVFYQGVDSLLVNDAGRRALFQAGEIAGDELGKLRWQKTVSAGEIVGTNEYTLGDDLTISGISSKAQRLGPGHWREQRFITAGDLFTVSRADGVRIEETDIHRRGTYSKRKVNDNGQTEAHVYPLEGGEANGR